MWIRNYTKIGSLEFIVLYKLYSKQEFGFVQIINIWFFIVGKNDKNFTDKRSKTGKYWGKGELLNL